MNYFLLTDNLTKIVGKLDNLTYGSRLCFNLPITSWTLPLLNLNNGSDMFAECKNLKIFKSPLDLLSNGEGMFSGCASLEKWDIPLPSLKNAGNGGWGGGMFNFCTNLKSWNLDLPEVTYTRYMFDSCNNLISFIGDMPKVTYTVWMFRYCYKLKSFTGDLSSLTEAGSNGYGGMFRECKSLTDFNSKLPKLTHGGDMFYQCKLNLLSIQNIAESINDVRNMELTNGGGTLLLGIDKNLQNNSNLIEALEKIRSKGWTVTEQYN